MLVHMILVNLLPDVNTKMLIATITMLALKTHANQVLDAAIPLSLVMIIILALKMNVIQ